ncbi:T-cell-specific surface glycoprotein CD28 isoform 2-T2 [Spinachia spinachia]
MATHNRPPHALLLIRPPATQHGLWDQIKTVCVPVGVEVSVPCPNSTGQEVIFNLYKDDEEICEHVCNKAGMKQGKDDKSFTLTVVNASSNGMYGCQRTVTYPPPLTKSTLWIIVHVEGHQCNVQEGPSTAEARDRFLWIWILGLVLLCSYSLIITIIASIVWVKWRSLNCQNDYMNTKPKANKDRRKKMGVQIPSLRHF